VDVTNNPGGGAPAMQLDNDSHLHVFGALSVDGNVQIGGSQRVFGAATIDGNAQIGGSLRVAGNTRNVFNVLTFELAVGNAGQDAGGAWNINFGGRFAEVYTVFAVLRGFSLWDLSAGPVERPPGAAIGWAPDAGKHVISEETIPQLCFVRVDAWTNNGASGVAYLSESKASLEGDNSVLFTVVVMGKGA
jgi:hypothetical protein